jgi:hypothetical protein
MIRGLDQAAQPNEPQRRIPDHHIFKTGRPGTSFEAEPLDLGEIALSGVQREPLAATNRIPGDRRDLTGPLTALLALGLGLLGALYVGKRYTDSHVIVVPATTNEHSVIT